MATKSAIVEKNGVVYTKPWVVELILDLAGYTPDKDLASMVLIEPSAGDGGFLVLIAERLIESARQHGKEISQLGNAIIAYELNEQSTEQCRLRVSEQLQKHDVDRSVADSLAEQWIVTGDFLLAAHSLPRADFVIGNPPYIRLEDVPTEIAATYRKQYRTMAGRADIYVAFFEAGLDRLKANGVCAYICADRWMLNQYGTKLRGLITAAYSVESVVELHHADAFDQEVSAYPAITVIRREAQGRAVVARAGKSANPAVSREVAEIMTASRSAESELIQVDGFQIAAVEQWFQGEQPWPCYSPERLQLLRYLESNFYPVDSRATGTKSGIGVASGADKIFLTKDAELVEPDRLLPMTMAKDIRSGAVNWSGHYLVNPWTANGLVNLENYPRLQSYFSEHEELLRNRHIGKKNAAAWYRTIDKVDPTLLAASKLYIADIKERLIPVLDNGETYPHHNLYYVRSIGWDIEVLGGLLMSDIAQFFIECYAVRMRGGYLRFQAQYLRRIRLPRPMDVSPEQSDELRTAFQTRDIERATATALPLYGIDRIPEDTY